MKTADMTTKDFLDLEAASAQAKIDGIKNKIAKESPTNNVVLDSTNSNSTKVPVVVLKTR